MREERKTKFRGPPAWTFAFHQDRERAPHLEQPCQRQRLLAAASEIKILNPASVVDLGCGDGGLLSLVKDIPSWGYDFAPANEAGWIERGVTAYAVDVFNDRPEIKWGELAVATEILEHLEHPHEAVKWIASNSRFIVCSSPHSDTLPDDTHAWAWDREGYRALLEPHFVVLKHFDVEWAQLIVGESRWCV